jgi:hypothetical protein
MRLFDALIGALSSLTTLKEKKSKNREETPMPKILCSKVSVKSNCAHLRIGPQCKSATWSQGGLAITARCCKTTKSHEKRRDWRSRATGAFQYISEF